MSLLLLDKIPVESAGTRRKSSLQLQVGVLKGIQRRFRQHLQKRWSEIVDKDQEEQVEEEKEGEVVEEGKGERKPDAKLRDPEAVIDDDTEEGVHTGPHYKGRVVEVHGIGNIG